MSRIEISYPDTTHFSTHLNVRISDVNYQKHLGHDRLVSMLHEARSEFFERQNLPELGDQDLGTLVADLAIVFAGEAFYEDALRFDISVQNLSTRSCQLYYRVVRKENTEGQETLIAKAKSGIVFYDYGKKEAAPIPSAFKSKFA